jgi:hypothetical protein
MREIRQSGSEGRETDSLGLPYPYLGRLSYFLRAWGWIALWHAVPQMAKLSVCGCLRLFLFPAWFFPSG